MSPKMRKERTALSCCVAIVGQSGERTCQCHVGKGHVNVMSKEMSVWAYTLKDF
jgi:hypothetical protein